MKIALMGYARSGKDTIAEMIWRNAEGLHARVGFGDALKREFHDMFIDIPKEPKPRKGYEVYGEGMKQIDPAIWVKKLAFHIDTLEQYDLYHDFIITDLRQPIEHDWARENGYIIVRVFSPTELREERSTGDTEFVEVNHSERFIEELDYDFAIDNIGTLQDLEAQVIQLIKIYGEEMTYAE